MTKILKTAVFGALLIGAFSYANDIDSKNIEIIKPYMKVTAPGAKATAIFLEIKNKSDKTLNLVSASSTLTKNTEIHAHKMEDGMMVMSQVNTLK